MIKTKVFKLKVFMENIIKAFMNPNFYDHEVEDVKIFQTHISYVFLTGSYAYKIKKPVNFGFLDFSTLDKRKIFCEKELELNRRLCGDMYIDVLPVTMSEGGIELNGRGEVVEYTLKMKEFPQERIMDNMLERDEVTKEHIDRIARIMSDFYINTQTSDEINRYGSVDAIKFNWNENFEQTEEFMDKTIDREKFQLIKNSVNNFMEEKRYLFEQRIRDGRIKDCHGDLHSRNIFIVNGIYIFDAIEFNERFRFSDTAADIAFFIMDLDFKNRKDLSEFFLNRYLEYSNDNELLKLLDFYKCYRAYVRGKVLSFKLNDKYVDENDKKESAHMAKKYFDLSHKYAKLLVPKS